jgi:hypothetical protein
MSTKMGICTTCKFRDISSSNLNDGFTLLSQKELGVLLIPPSGREKAENWRGLDAEHKLQIKFEDAERYNS